MECSFKDCGKRAVSRKLCNGHYKQLRRGEELMPLKGPHGKKYDHSRTYTNRSGPRLIRYNLSQEQYAALFASQGNACGACGVTESARQWHIDHDHRCCPGVGSCGKCVRGILCPACNNAAGLLLDDPIKAARLAAYLKRTSA